MKRFNRFHLRFLLTLAGIVFFVQAGMAAKPDPTPPREHPNITEASVDLTGSEIILKSETEMKSIFKNTNFIIVVRCPFAHPDIISGGCALPVAAALLFRSEPVTIPTGDPAGWVCGYQGINNTLQPVTVTAICK